MRKEQTSVFDEILEKLAANCQSVSILLTAGAGAELERLDSYNR